MSGNLLLLLRPMLLAMRYCIETLWDKDVKEVHATFRITGARMKVQFHESRQDVEVEVDYKEADEEDQ